MQVAKLGRKQGLAPVGSYFEAIARGLREANVREAKLQAELDQEDRDLEMLYRRGSASRSNVYAEAAA
jgi:hypothetical protein